MKRVLLTNLKLVDFAGSELNLVQLVKAFKAMDFEVHVATFEYGNPIKKLLDSEEVNVKVILNDKLEQDSFDIIWCQHSILLTELLFNQGVRSERILLSSLGPLNPFEGLPPYWKEVSMVIGNSIETLETIQTEFSVAGEGIVFPNCAPKDYFEILRIKNDQLKKIAIVSNHPPKEILQAKFLFEKQGYKVEIFGMFHKKQLIDSSVLSGFDCVITIGKTVQYALSLQIPVYCYDQFGGSGWVNKKNIQEMEKYNFSGRDSRRKISAAEIVEEIKNGFNKVLEASYDLRCYAKEHFEFENIFKKIYEQLLVSSKTDCLKILNSYLYLKRDHQIKMDLYRDKIELLKYAGNQKKDIQILKRDILKIEKSEKDLNDYLKLLEKNIFIRLIIKLFNITY